MFSRNRARLLEHQVVAGAVAAVGGVVAVLPVTVIVLRRSGLAHRDRSAVPS